MDDEKTPSINIAIPTSDNVFVCGKNNVNERWRYSMDTMYKCSATYRDGSIETSCCNAI